jgi:glyoxylase-like metal-dependent hydrolase (beta-lactamase superfamily II)
MTKLPTYEVFALRYATRPGKRRDMILGGDPHDADMPMDYFLWLLRSSERTVLVDTGFDHDMAQKRNRTLLRVPRDALAMLDADAAQIRDVVITHLHNDHVGTYAHFPRATFHLQDAEMNFATGRHMCHERFRRSFEVDHVTGMVRLLYEGRLRFHDGDDEIHPGISVHHIGGHTPGMQAVRVHTRRGWVVLASDASHYYEHFERDLCFPVVYHLGDLLAGYSKLRQLADSPRHIVPGHDPLVMQRYPAASPATHSIAVRLDVEPSA